MHGEWAGGDSLSAAMAQMGRTLGRAFAIARDELGMSVDEVARAARVSPATVRRVEAGDIAPFSLNSLERIGRALAIDVELQFVPQEAELLVLAASVETPVHVFARPPAPTPADEAERGDSR